MSHVAHARLAGGQGRLCRAPGLQTLNFVNFNLGGTCLVSQQARHGPAPRSVSHTQCSPDCGKNSALPPSNLGTGQGCED